jgi:hypothetical protein
VIATAGGMAGQTNDKQVTMGASGGADLGVSASTAGKVSDLTGPSQTTSASVGPVAGSIAQSSTATTVTVGGGLGGGVSGSSYKTNTVDVLRVVKDKIEKMIK